jgi:hypothetical protein
VNDFCVILSHVFLLDINAAMRQPCDLLQQVPGSSSSSRHQRFDRQSRGGKDDQGDFLEEGKEVWYTASTMTMIKYRLFTLFDSGIRRLDLHMDGY